MNALEIANELTAPIGTSGQSTYATCEQAAATIRRQHEAIVKLREALEGVSDGDIYLPPITRSIVLEALNDTEGFK